MSIQLPPNDQKAAEQLVATGRFSSIEDVVSEGIRRLVSNENLRSAVQTGIDQADAGELIDHESAFERLRSLAASNDGRSN